MSNVSQGAMFLAVFEKIMLAAAEPPKLKRKTETTHHVDLLKQH
jgi:hypothetical protein